MPNAALAYANRAHRGRDVSSCSGVPCVSVGKGSVVFGHRVDGDLRAARLSGREIAARGEPNDLIAYNQRVIGGMRRLRPNCASAGLL